MPNKTLYVKDSDVAMVDEAEKLLGSTLSSIFANCLRERLAKLKARTEGEFSKISLRFFDSSDQSTVTKSFTGRWIVSDPSRGLGAEADDSGVSWGHSVRFAVALTAKGKLVVYEFDESGERAPAMEVFEDFAEIRDALIDDRYPAYPRNLVAETAAALGEEYEVELDI